MCCVPDARLADIAIRWSNACTPESNQQERTNISLPALRQSRVNADAPLWVDRLVSSRRVLIPRRRLLTGHHQCSVQECGAVQDQGRRLIYTYSVFSVYHDDKQKRKRKKERKAEGNIPAAFACQYESPRSAMEPILARIET